MKYNYWQILGLVLVAAVAIMAPDMAWADAAPFTSLKSRVCDTWTNGKSIVYVIGGIAALTLGVLAFFGRFKWTTFFALVGGIFLIAIFDQILSFASQGGSAASISC